MASDRCFDGQLWQPHYGDVISVDSRLQIKPLLRARKPRSPQNKDDIFGTVLFLLYEPTPFAAYDLSWS